MPEFYLDHLQGERAGVVDQFDKRVVTVGRNDQADLSVDELGVSWDHAEFRLRDDAWWLIDVGSTNGTYINEERAHNARLKDGDIVKFGKKGGMCRFRLQPVALSESSGSAPRPAPPRKKRKRVPSELELPVLPAAALASPIEKAPARAQSGHPAAADGDKKAVFAVALLGAVSATALVLLGLLFIQYQSLDTELIRSDTKRVGLQRELESSQRAAKLKITAAREEGRSEVRRTSSKDLSQARARLERTLRDLAAARRSAEEHQGRVQRLEQDLATARRRVATLENDRKLRRSRPASSSSNWKEIERSVRSSVVFIAVTLKGRKKDGTTVPLNGFGTGFFASSQGHIVTNKHVVQPWKFREMATRLAKEGIEVLHDTYQVHAWQGGTRFLKTTGGHRQLDPSTGFSTQNGSLEVVRTAKDHFVHMKVPGTETSIKVQRNDGTSDLAILRARGASVTPIPIGKSSELEKLDEVLVVGFPAGPSIFEGDKAVTSPAQGHVRKVEQTIFVSAAMIPGNSGGPLLNGDGKVVGVCTRIFRKSETLGSCLKIEHAMDLLHGGSW